MPGFCFGLVAQIYFRNGVRKLKKLNVPNKVTCTHGHIAQHALGALQTRNIQFSSKVENKERHKLTVLLRVFSVQFNSI